MQAKYKVSAEDADIVVPIPTQTGQTEPLAKEFGPVPLYLFDDSPDIVS
jgi:hypothetical protein